MKNILEQEGNDDDYEDDEDDNNVRKHFDKLIFLFVSLFSIGKLLFSNFVSLNRLVLNFSTSNSTWENEKKKLFNLYFTAIISQTFDYS